MNSTGHSYEVGLWVAGWPAAALLSAVVHILIEEKIGYNVTETGPGPGMPDAFYAMAGCATPTDVIDPGCGDGPTGTLNHVCIEGWTLAYQGIWDLVQKKYPATAPRNLGKSGYYGRIGTYLESATVTRALDAEGGTLDFFRSYNATWYDQSKYFGGITMVNTSLLKPCTETRSMIHEVMQTYADFTGDHDGVEIVEGKVQGRCWDRYFWLPPSCRHDRSKCILFATGGAGWHLAATMQKATVWNMPIAPVVAKDWASFVEIPRQVTCLFYWWEPDPTFLLLQPTEVFFPQHEKHEWAQAIQTSAAEQVPIEKYVSYDLDRVAPEIVALIQAMTIDMVEVKELMTDQLNSQNDAAVVACRWLQNHTSIWETWLPDATKCFPQFGLYNEVSKTFVRDRADSAGLGCRACESGSFSVELQDDKGTTHVCNPCLPGSAQPSGAAKTCDPCPRGEYQDAFGEASCTRCPQGTYQDQKGQSSCNMCPNGTTTLGLGSMAIEECRCEAGSIMNEGLACVPCGEGMVCPFGSTVRGLLHSTSDVGEKYVPMIAEGYYSHVKNPTSIFKCTEKKRCPGGRPGSCSGGLAGAPRAECLPGQTWSDERCVTCDTTTTAIWWVLVTVVLPSALVASYYLMNPRMTAKASTVQAGGAAFALLLLLVQTVSIMASTTIAWPQNFRNSAAPLSIALLDLEGLSFSCFNSGSIVVRYISNIVAFPLLVVWMWLCFAMSKLLPFPRLRWKPAKTCNALGGLLQMSYGPMSMLALQPFMCYSHPNGSQSLLKQPSIFCSEGEHRVMLVGGCLLLVLFVFGFLAACLVAACSLPCWLARGNSEAARCFNFLMIRFRMDMWWFGALSMVRMPILSSALAMATDNPLTQAALSGPPFDHGKFRFSMRLTCSAPFARCSCCLLDRRFL